jgi:hypothetical protein
LRIVDDRGEVVEGPFMAGTGPMRNELSHRAHRPALSCARAT